MTETNDREDRLRRDVDRAVDEAGGLLGKLQFADVVDGLGRARESVPDLDDRLRRLRARGFAFGGDLEGKLAGAAAQVPEVSELVLRESRQVSERLLGRVNQLGATARRLAAMSSLLAEERAVEALEREVDAVTKAIREGEERVQGVADRVTEPVKGVKAAVERAEQLMNRFDTTKFSLQPDEHPLAVFEATWEDARGGPRKGTLLFTDARVRFEHFEEVVTKKKLFFFAAEKQLLHEVLLDEPIGLLERSSDSTRGWVLKDQILTFEWGQRRSCPATTTFEVEGRAKDVDALVESIRDGSIAAQRYRGPGAVTEEILEFPAVCRGCGAPLPAAVKGQRSLPCPFCSTENPPIGSPPQT